MHNLFKTGDPRPRRAIWLKLALTPPCQILLNRIRLRRGKLKIMSFVLKHKWGLSALFLVLAGVGYFGWQKYFPKAEQIKYVTAKAERGSLINSLSGTGQISATNQVDIQTKASGSLIILNAVVGKEVKAGELIAQINASDAFKSIRDAESNLASARLSLEKLKQPSDQLSIIQAEHAIEQAKESKEQTADNLNKSYDDGFNTISNVFLELPGIMTGIHDMLYDSGLESYQSNIDWYANRISAYRYDDTDKAIKYRDSINKNYSTALKMFNANYDSYKSASRLASTTTIESLILETYDDAKVIADLVKEINNYIDFAQDAMESFQFQVQIPPTMATHQSNLDSYTAKTNSHLLNLLSIKNSIANYKTSLVGADRTILEKTESLANLKAGADALDIKSQEISIKQKENSLADARENLADYSVRALFDGVIAKVDVKKGDEVSAGTTVATLITRQQTATIALNEVDVAKVKLGQKANLTFDAVEGLVITGEVVEVDTLGTVSQGVVSYNVKIIFDVQDERIKPGMSASANIILSIKPDVLVAPSLAVKSQNGASYVEILVSGAPQTKNVEVGSSNDTMTEIISGLNEGDEVVTQKITTGAASVSAGGSTTNRSSGPASGDMFRMMR